MGTHTEQLERQAREIRSQMSTTLEELRTRISPGQVVDQIADYAREGPPAEFLRNLGREARENPLPLALIGIGVVWLVIASKLSSRRSRIERFVHQRTRHEAEPGVATEPANRRQHADEMTECLAVAEGGQAAMPAVAGSGVVKEAREHQ